MTAPRRGPATAEHLHLDDGEPAAAAHVAYLAGPALRQLQAALRGTP